MATQREIADHVGISQPAVAVLVRAGVIAPAGRGSYDLDAARLSYCAHLREQAAGRAGKPGAALDLATERARLAAAQAEAQERKNAKERRELVVLADVTNAVAAVVELTKVHLGKVGAIVAKGDAALRRRIERAVADALADLAAVEVINAGGIDPGKDDEAHPPASNSGGPP